MAAIATYANAIGSCFLDDLRVYRKIMAGYRDLEIGVWQELRKDAIDQTEAKVIRMGIALDETLEPLHLASGFLIDAIGVLIMGPEYALAKRVPMNGGSVQTIGSPNERPGMPAGAGDPAEWVCERSWHNTESFAQSGDSSQKAPATAKL